MKSYHEKKKEWSENYLFQKTIKETGEITFVDAGKVREALRTMRPRAKETKWKLFLAGEITIDSIPSHYAFYKAIKK
jgi:hypothetical protein